MPARKKIRLDQCLVDRGIVETRSKAQAVIRAGEVLSDEIRLEKPGTLVDPDVSLRISSPTVDVSRGAAKLRGALDRFPLEIGGRVAADLGASTGGFTQVLLEKGASRVHTFDVGYGLLHLSLRKDPRVIVHDRVNVRHLTEKDVEPIEVVTVDLSFIGLELVLPAIRRTSAADADCVALVKPQFEAGKERVEKGGIVKNRDILLEVLKNHVSDLAQNGFDCWGLFPAELKGKKGNQEFLSWFRKTESYGKNPQPIDPAEIISRL